MPENAIGQHEGISHAELDGLSIYLLKITPEVAADLLLRNTKNQRTISEDAVERYAGDMITEDWIFNGAPVLISNKGELIDGQHRLSAIVASGTPQLLLVVHGVDAEAMMTVDAGRKRSYADILYMRGVAHHTTVAALTSRVWWWFHFNYGTRQVGRIANAPHLGATPSNAQRDFWMKKIEAEYEITFVHAAKFASSAYSKRRGLSMGTYGLAWILLSGIDKDLRDQFFNELLDGSTVTTPYYPITSLHNKLNNVSANELSQADQLHMLFRTYNHWTKGLQLKTVTAPRLVRHDLLEIPSGYTELSEDKQA